MTLTNFILLTHIFPCVINYSEVDNIRPHKLLLLIAVILLVTVLGAVPATVLIAGADETAVFHYDGQYSGHHSPMPGNSASEAD